MKIGNRQFRILDFDTLLEKKKQKQNSSQNSHRFESVRIRLSIFISIQVMRWVAGSRTK